MDAPLTQHTGIYGAAVSVILTDQRFVLAPSLGVAGVLRAGLPVPTIHRQVVTPVGRVTVRELITGVLG